MEKPAADQRAVQVVAAERVGSEWVGRAGRAADDGGQGAGVLTPDDRAEDGDEGDESQDDKSGHHHARQRPTGCPALPRGRHRDHDALSMRGSTRPRTMSIASVITIASRPSTRIMPWIAG